MCLAVPGKIIEITGSPTSESPFDRKARVSFGGIVKEVCLACVPQAKPGEYVIVHVGFALSIIDEEEANRVFDYLREMDELAELSTP